MSIFARSDAGGGATVALVATEDALRKRVRRLVDLGVSQKILATRMGMSEPSLSRWLNQVPGAPRITVQAMDRFNKFAEELATVAKPNLEMRVASSS